MKLLTWDETYSVGVEESDSQHQWLVEIINVLFEALSEGKGTAVMDTVLESLIQYTKAHFATEETLMRANGYPALVDHAAAHLELGRKVAGWQQAFRRDQAPLTNEMLTFLKDWLESHEVEVDRPMGHYLNACGVK